MLKSTKAITHTTFTRFESSLHETVTAVRDRLQLVEDMRCFELIIKAEGRVHDGEVKITFTLEQNYSDQTRGGRLEPTLNEFLRRHGWNETNHPTCIGGPVAVAADEAE